MMPAATLSRLSEPSEAAVRHATREVEYAERLVIHKMTAGTGNEATQVYNFPALVNTLFGTSWHLLSDEGTKASIVWVDSGKLTAWIRDVLGDAEFADAVAAALEGTDHFKAQIDAMLPIFRERVAQYQAVLNPPEVESIDDGAVEAEPVDPA